MVIKRIFDFTFALLVSIFAIPITAVSALVIKIASPESPVIFRQKRIGYQGETFVANNICTVDVDKKSLKMRAIYS